VWLSLINYFKILQQFYEMKHQNLKFQDPTVLVSFQIS